MATATAMRVVDMIGELDRGSLVPPGGLWRSLLSVGAKISILDAVAARRKRCTFIIDRRQTFRRFECRTLILVVDRD